ncbi:D-aminoacyl-tRNA deacylase [Halocatena marina]|uniref:D-aminoacyl-tRNA deacylase n=1 Tax=Halocatena marina TaxID=2934937 RepID=UPI0022249B18|nr:D-aminoacyl-tRNA deacylase [Halocatena marina]
MIGIVVSRADSASLHICEQLLALADWEEHETQSDVDGDSTVYRLEDVELRIFDELHLHLDAVDEVFCDPSLIVFASRHAGETGALLTAHPTGNFGPAEFGGHDHDLARAAPNAQAKALTALTEHAPAGYDVGLEGTHHGPTAIDTPSLFVELGSDESQWNDPDGARAVAQAILDLRGVDPERERTVVGFGGGHYVPRFERVVRDTDWAVGHVAVDWALDAMGDPTENANRAVLEQAFEQSSAEYALIDGTAPALERTVESLGYPIVSETWMKETTGVPLELVKQLERDAMAIENGLRFGDSARQLWTENDDQDPHTSYSQLDLPSDLLAEVNGIDHERILSTIRSYSIAVTTVEGGTKLGKTVVLPESVDRNDLMEEFITVLDTKYDDVERDGDQIVAHRTAFSPTLAREQGVPEGPAFGRLSDGQTVEIDNTTVTPGDVRERQTYMFSSI